MLALCLMLSVIYYAKNYAGIIGWSVLTVTTLKHMLLMPETKGSHVHVLLITACVSDYVHMHKLCCLRTEETHAKLLTKSTARDS